jgi:hypothetical protein
VKKISTAGVLRIENCLTPPTLLERRFFNSNQPQRSWPQLPLYFLGHAAGYCIAATACFSTRAS